MKTPRRILFSLLALVSFFCATPPQAQATNSKDLIVGINALTVLKKKAENPVIVAIIYNPQNPDSIKDATAIQKAIQTGLETPQEYNLKPEIVSVENPTLLQTAQIAFLARGLTLDHFEKIADLTKRTKTLTMSTDLDCVRSNYCVLGIVSRPQVEIYYSPSAAHAAKIEFHDIFTLLSLQITETPSPEPSA